MESILKVSDHLSNKVVDHTSNKIKEYFLYFLENFEEKGTTSEKENAENECNRHNSSIGSLLFSDIKSCSDNPVAQRVNVSKAPGYYRRQVIGMKNDGTNIFYVDFGHVFQFNEMLANAIIEGYYRFEPYLRAALFSFVKSIIPDYAYVSSTKIRKEFWVAFYGFNLIYKLRELTSTKIGMLLGLSGTVTRTSEVRPELYLGTFQCNECRTVIKDIEQQFKYTEPKMCANSLCGNRTKWTLLIDQSLFIDWQRLRVQENSNEIPQGSMPRTIDIILRNDLVERVKAGDKCEFTGCLIVIPDVGQLALPNNKLNSDAGRYSSRYKNTMASTVTGIKSLGVRELSYKIAFLCNMVTNVSGNSENNAMMARLNAISHSIENNVFGKGMLHPHVGLFSFEEQEEIYRIKSTPNLYTKLVESIAPSIFGHYDIKAGILLMLFGGVHKSTKEGINLRGDINVCIVGDPGTSKSTFLKYITRDFLSRSIYACGKSSSAAGLTASVAKDEETGEFTIEAGALMLSDNGICAIDEFDKMDLKDQIAIHEAMEQQTISIAKAGIQATLNARTSILAAANPVNGRYDKRKSLRQNIAMSPPIMSRFDLFFVLVDECNENMDYNIARHILSVHRFGDEALEPEFSISQLQLYIMFARFIKPVIPEESVKLIVEKYKTLRQGLSSNVGTFGTSRTGSSYKITVRQLESLIRLSEALAKLHMDVVVRPKYVNEAYRLLKSSIMYIESDSIDLNASNALGAFDINESVDTNTEGSGVLQDRKSSRTLSIKFEEYVRITNLIVYNIRKKETENEDIEESVVGMRKSDVIEWYLEISESDIQTEAQYYQKKHILEAVIERLIHKDCVLLELKEGKDSDPLLVVHPNYNP